MISDLYRSTLNEQVPVLGQHLSLDKTSKPTDAKDAAALDALSKVKIIEKPGKSGLPCELDYASGVYCLDSLVLADPTSKFICAMYGNLKYAIETLIGKQIIALGVEAVVGKRSDLYGVWQIVWMEDDPLKKHFRYKATVNFKYIARNS